MITVGKPHDPHLPKYLEVYGHRGARSLAPEMTLEGYQIALDIGVDWVDIDIVLSANDILMAYHDLELNPDTTSFEGKRVTPKPVKQFTAAELKKFNVGIIDKESAYAKLFPNQIIVPNATMPTLQEVIDFVGKRAHFQIEMKEDCSEILYTFLKKNNLINFVEIQSFDWKALAHLQKLDNRIKTAYLFSEKGPTPKLIKKLGGSCYEPMDEILTKKEVIEAHALGLKVVPWCCPGREHLIPLFIDWGVDGLILDDPKIGIA